MKKQPRKGPVEELRQALRLERTERRRWARRASFWTQRAFHWKAISKAYGEQLDDIGKTLVKAGLITSTERGRHGVRCAIERKLFPRKAYEMKAKKKRKKR